MKNTSFGRMEPPREKNYSPFSTFAKASKGFGASCARAGDPRYPEDGAVTVRPDFQILTADTLLDLVSRPAGESRLASPSGEGFIRFSAFGHRADVVEAVRRLKESTKGTKDTKK
jgi:hypothetical protein